MNHTIDLAPTWREGVLNSTRHLYYGAGPRSITGCMKLVYHPANGHAFLTDVASAEAGIPFPIRILDGDLLIVDGRGYTVRWSNDWSAVRCPDLRPISEALA